MNLNRRKVLLATLAGGIFATGYGAFSFDHAPILSPVEALRRVRAGSLILIDIRRPDEWRATGIAEGAVPIDMRGDDFLALLAQATGGRKDVAVAMICAAGVRSRRQASAVLAEGYTNVSDVGEGMLGSSAGAGWIARGLPLMPYSGSQ